MNEERIRALLEYDDTDSNYDDQSDSNAEDNLEVQKNNTDPEQEGDLSKTSEESSETPAKYYVGKDPPDIGANDVVNEMEINHVPAPGVLVTLSEDRLSSFTDTNSQVPV
ncbi:hypothetical protein ACJJTC_005227 [Scirpophaga incertulas]